MTIGIIGPALSCQQVREHIRAISPETETILYPREASADALDAIEACEAACSAVLFTGRGPCDSVVQRHTMNRAYEYISKESHSLMMAFREMERLGAALDNFSIDVVEPHVVEDACSELGIAPQHIHQFPFDSFDEETYIRWHQDLWDRGETKAIVTGFVWVYQYFKERDYPVFYLPVSRPTVREAFGRLKARLELKEAHSAQIVVEIIEMGSVAESAGTYYADRLKVCQAERLITEYCQKIQASFFRHGRDSYIIFANRGGAKREENYRWLYDLQAEILKTGFHPSIGIGIGATAYQSEINARKAVSHAEAGRYIYMINEEGALVGPLGQEQSITYDLISHGTEVDEIAGRVGMSNAYIAKLMSLIQLRGSAVFDVTELADCLGVTTRSAHRIISKLLAADCAAVCGKESTAAAGRPKSLIEIHFGSSAARRGPS